MGCCGVENSMLNSLDFVFAPGFPEIQSGFIKAFFISTTLRHPISETRYVLRRSSQNKLQLICSREEKKNFSDTVPKLKHHFPETSLRPILWNYNVTNSL